MTKEERIEISIKELIELSNKLGRCPKVIEFESSIKLGFSRRILEKHLGMKYNDICLRYIPNIKLNLKQSVTKDEILNDLIKLYNILKRTPKFEEFKSYSGHTYKVIKRVFNQTYNQVIKDLGFVIIKKTTSKKAHEQLLFEFKNLYNKLKRLPTTYEINNNISSVNTYVKNFKSIENICNILNLDYGNQKLQSGVGESCYDLNNIACRSKIEQEISNFFIINNIKFKKEVKYSDLISNMNSRMRFDFKFYKNNKEYYIEYFGLYKLNAKTNMHKNYKKKTRKKIKKIYKTGNINKCIFIFPSQNKNIKNILKKYI